MRRVRLDVRGDVQGVGFRAATQATARALNLSGWVRNRPDGSVEIAAEGDDESIRLLLDWARTGPRQARVEDVAITEEQPTGSAGPFSVRFD